jgi:outer membrane protein TolC
LPEPQLKYEQWGTPLRRPWAVRESNAVMVGVSQALPAWGTRAARSRMAEEDEATAVADVAIRRRELRVRVRRAFAEYYRADRELRLHREHVELTTRLVELARSAYRAGHGVQQDVLRLQLELSRLHRDLAHIEQEGISARAQLNALMNRPVDAPLGPPAALPAEAAPAPTPPPQVPPTPVDADPAVARRAELAAAAAAVRRSDAALTLARNERAFPTVTLSLDYMYMPMMAAPHGYGAMAMFGLPWLSAGKHDAVRAAELTVAADRHALAAARNDAAFELRDARARYDAARSTFTIVDTQLLVQAQRAFDAAYSAYAAGKGDAIGLIDSLRSYLDVRLDRVGALVHLELAATDLARAASDPADDERARP